MPTTYQARTGYEPKTLYLSSSCCVLVPNERNRINSSRVPSWCVLWIRCNLLLGLHTVTDHQQLCANTFVRHRFVQHSCHSKNNRGATPASQDHVYTAAAASQLLLSCSSAASQLITQQIGAPLRSRSHASPPAAASQLLLGL